MNRTGGCLPRLPAELHPLPAYVSTGACDLAQTTFIREYMLWGFYLSRVSFVLFGLALGLEHLMTAAAAPSRWHVRTARLAALGIPLLILTAFDLPGVREITRPIGMLLMTGAVRDMHGSGSWICPGNDTTSSPWAGPFRTRSLRGSPTLCRRPQKPKPRGDAVGQHDAGGNREHSQHSPRGRRAMG